MEQGITRRTFTWLFALLLALVVAPGTAFASEMAAQADGYDWSAISDTDTIFTVKVETADGQVKDFPFTKKQLVDMAKENSEVQYYTFQGKGKLTTVAAEEYVRLDQLLNATEANFSDGDKIICKSSSFTPQRDTEFASLNETRKYYPGYTLSAYNTSADDKEVPAILALKFGSADTIDKETTAGSLEESALSKSSYQGLRNFWGKTATDYSADGNMGGNSYAGGAETLVVYKPFNVYTQVGSSDKQLVKRLYQEDINSKAETAADDGLGFLYNKGNSWQVGVAVKYITINDLLKLAMGDEFALAQGQSIIARASDGFATTLSYEQITANKYFYPATTSSSIVASNPEEPGTILALTWGTTEGNDAVTTVDKAGTAGAAKMAIAAEAEKLNSQYRIFTGLSSPTDSNTGGNRFATGPAELYITTVKSIDSASVSVSGVNASYPYTGSAIEPTITVKDGDTVLSPVTRKGGDYSVSYENNTAIGTAKVVITGANAYSGKKEITFAIEKPADTTPPSKLANTITAKGKSVTLKAKNLKKKAQVVKTTKAVKVSKAKGKVAYVKVKANKKNANFKVSKAGNITVKKGTPKGTYKVKIKVTAAGTDTYASLTKTFTTTIKVK